MFRVGVVFLWVCNLMSLLNLSLSLSLSLLGIACLLNSIHCHWLLFNLLMIFPIVSVISNYYGKHSFRLKFVVLSFNTESFLTLHWQSVKANGSGSLFSILHLPPGANIRNLMDLFVIFNQKSNNHIFLYLFARIFASFLVNCKL